MLLSIGEVGVLGVCVLWGQVVRKMSEFSLAITDEKHCSGQRSDGIALPPVIGLLGLAASLDQLGPVLGPASHHCVHARGFWARGEGGPNVNCAPTMWQGGAQ